MNALLRTILYCAACLAVAAPLGAQTHAERARTILQLFEAGERDTAYQLIEPLKREARFVPAVIYTRAQMTPDDRALTLYREIIALEPKGEWADDAAHQLVRRYVEKSDSEAAYIWAGVLKREHPSSPFVALTEEMLTSIESWEIDMPGPGAQLADAGGRADATPDRRPEKSDTSAAPKPRAAATGGKGGAVTTTDPTKPAETISASGMRGYALQVGLFPTRVAAGKQAAELAKKKLRAVPLPKTINGRTQYALVVGPYPSIEVATKKKPDISKICECQSFIVKVE